MHSARRFDTQLVALFASLFGLLAGATSPVQAQDVDGQAKIDRAMEAAHAAVAGEATVMDVDGTVLREGSNGWTCLPEVAPGNGVPMCNDDVWMELRDALLDQSEFSTDRLGISYMLAGDAMVNNADPYDREPNEGEVWIREGPHMMLVLPDRSMLEGLPRDPGQGGPYVMWDDTPYVHVMVPLGPRPEQ